MWDRPDILNRMAQGCIAFAVLLALWAALHFVTRMQVFAVHEIRVNGPIQHVTREQVEAIASSEVRGTFFTVNLVRVRTAFEKLPWVHSAGVRRQWPDRLEVTLEEFVPLARWGDSALVDADGNVFAAAYDGKLPLFEGPDGSAKELTIQYGYFKNALAAIGEVPTAVRLSARRAWHVRLASGMELELGRTSIEQRLDRFVSLYDRTLKPLHRRLDYVDLRYSNGFAVRIPEFDGRNAVAKKRS
jgi:cell division protein FtsQ